LNTIFDKAAHPKGILFTFEAKNKHIQILFLNHAVERMAKGRCYEGGEHFENKTLKGGKV